MGKELLGPDPAGRADLTTPTLAGFHNALRASQLAAVAQMVRCWPYRDDQASDWTPDLNRDCQGKASWARARLLEAGWPADCMDLYVCTLPDGRRHAVLVAAVTLSHGVREIAICNLIGEPRAKDSLPYTEWVRAEA